MAKPIVLLTVGLCSAAALVFAFPSNPPDAAELLNKANAAAAKLMAISYEAKFYGQGSLADRVPMMSGKVIAKRGPTDGEHHFYVDGMGSIPGSDQKLPFKVAIDGKYAYSLDEKSKLFKKVSLAEVETEVGNPLFQPKYLHKTPFGKEIEAGSAEFRGVQDVDGVACNVVCVKSADPRSPDVTLFLGKKDNLLRRMEMTVQPRASMGKLPPAGQIIFSTSELNTHPNIDEKLFHLECPEGFRDEPWKAPPQSRGQNNLLPVGGEAPDWELKNSEGKTVTLKSLRGKVVVLEFWATWCGPCRMAMPGLQKLHERFADKPVAIFGVNCLERSRLADPVAFIKQQGYTYGQLLDGTMVSRAYHVDGIPCSYIIGPDGKILDARAGFNPMMEQLTATIIEKALKK